jgi:putrescine transport system permease protein
MKLRRLLIIGVPYLWLLGLFLVPFGIVLKISLSDTALAIPPYMPTLDISGGWQAIREFVSQLDLENFEFLTTDDLYWKAYLSSLQIAAVSTFFALLIGFPIAYGMAKAREDWRPTLMMLVILPFWTSFLIRVYAWVGILSTEGYLNQFLMGIGVIGDPLVILNTPVAVYIGIVYTYLPFMILPIYATLERLDESLIEAAEDLGCSRISAFWLITVPLSKNGVIAGCFLVFIPVIGEFVIPALLGGSKTLMIGKVLWEEFFSNRDWPVASAVAIILLLVLIIPIILFQRNEQRQREAEQ